jgi:hypothetical protein
MDNMFIGITFTLILLVIFLAVKVSRLTKQLNDVLEKLQLFQTRYKVENSKVTRLRSIIDEQIKTIQHKHIRLR